MACHNRPKNRGQTQDVHTVSQKTKCSLHLVARSVACQSNASEHARGRSSHAVAAHYYRLCLMLYFGVIGCLYREQYRLATSRETAAAAAAACGPTVKPPPRFAEKNTYASTHSHTLRYEQAPTLLPAAAHCHTGCASSLVWSRLMQYSCQTPVSCCMSLLFVPSSESCFQQYIQQKYRAPTFTNAVIFFAAGERFCVRSLYGVPFSLLVKLINPEIPPSAYDTQDVPPDVRQRYDRLDPTVAASSQQTLECTRR